MTWLLTAGRFEAAYAFVVECAARRSERAGFVHDLDGRLLELQSLAAMVTGRFEEAVRLLRELGAARPRDARTAATLATLEAEISSASSRC